jgi:hypothetical protein
MDNKSKLLKMGLKAIYYYLKLQDGSRVTVCLLLGEENKSLEARGITICSLKDQFVKKLGRAVACGRALQAITHKENLFPIKKQWMKEMYRWECYYHPHPTPYEYHIFLNT